jgi:hypothetical protein
MWIDRGNDGDSYAYFIECRNPFTDRIPKSVSLIENPCDIPENNLRVIHNVEKHIKKENEKRKFAVCLKDFDFKDDNSMWMIEWLEILKLLGANKVFIYVLKIHPKTLKALKFYEKRGFVKIINYAMPNRPVSITFEQVAMNDCFYQNMYTHDFVLPIDSDEIIMPVDELRTWNDIIDKLKA